MSDELNEAVELKTADTLINTGGGGGGESPSPIRCRICWGFEEDKAEDTLIIAC